MAKTAINAVWAQNTTNKANLDKTQIEGGILFESTIESKIPNTAIYTNSKAIKELQEGATLWLENKEYPQGSVVLVMISLGVFISQRMYIKISTDNKASFPMTKKVLHQDYPANQIYKLYPTNSNEWLEVSGYSTSNLVSEYIPNRAYEYNEECYIWVNRATQEIEFKSPNNPVPYLWKKLKITSCKNDNTTPPSQASLFNDWFIEDGHDIGYLIIDSANRNTPPLGYIQVNQNPKLQNDNDGGTRTDNSLLQDKTFSFTEYPRLKVMFQKFNDIIDTKDDGESDTRAYYFSVFKWNDDNTFKLTNDLRGYFMRAFSNNSSTLDANRDFYTAQECGLPNIRGDIEQNLSNFRREALPKTSGAFLYTYYSTGWAAASANGGHGYPISRIVKMSLNQDNPIYKDNYNDVAPYNFNVNIYVKV